MSLHRSLLSVDLGRGTRRFQRFVTLGGAKPRRRAAAPARRPRPGAAPGGDPARLPEARSATADQEPGDVRRRDHGRAGHADLARERDRPPDRRPASPGARLPGPDRDLALVHRPVRDLRRGGRRGPWPGPGGDAAQDPLGDDGPPAPARRHAREPSARPSSARATSSSSRRARRSPATATSSRASASSTRPRSPASRRRSSRSRAPTSGAR